uniref:Chlorocatechol 1,2-dioxygenase n=1 Tax=Sphingobium herbicidovorans TaxID=76947 RepID=Q700W9_9SPHN|nr:chlorocatechol 1,2-dioxygenase [Sphingobium herbicidovorans]
MSNRLEAVVADIVEGIRGALMKHDVTFDEYRQGIGYIMKTVEAGELPLMIDAFLNTTICQIENRNFGGSTSTLEGPYFLDDAPFVEGALKTYEDDRHEPLLLRGRVLDLAGAPVADAIIDVWHSTPDGHYGGFHNNIPRDFYRGKLRTDAAGGYEVRTTVPVAYKIPDQGPVGALLEAMGRHSWRPAHVHYKVRAPGFHTLTTQAYFEGGEYVDSDCCEGVHSELIHADVRESGIKVIETDFELAPALAHALQRPDGRGSCAMAKHRRRCRRRVNMLR